MSAFAGCLLLYGLAVVTSPPEIAGKWLNDQGEEVELTSTAAGEYSGVYTDSQGKPGKLKLAWSRTERRFNGAWSEGEDRFGEVSLRLVDGEIRGAVTTDAKSRLEHGEPRLADFAWRLAASVALPQKRLEKPELDDPELARRMEESSRAFLAQTEAAPILKMLQGTWQMTAGVDPRGTAADEGHVKAVRYVIRGNLLEFHNADDPKSVPKTRFTFDAGQKPFQLEFLDYTAKDADGKARRMVGLLEVSADTLKICWGLKLPEKLGPASGATYAELRRDSRHGHFWDWRPAKEQRPKPKASDDAKPKTPAELPSAEKLP